MNLNKFHYNTEQDFDCRISGHEIVETKHETRSHYISCIDFNYSLILE